MSRRIEAWAMVYPDGSFATSHRKQDVTGSPIATVAKLVEYSAAEEAVLRAAVKTKRAWDAYQCTDSERARLRWRTAAHAEDRAIERLQKSRKRKGAK